MSTGYVIYHCTPFIKVYFVVIHINVGYLGVLVQTSVGNAKAFDTWDE